MNLVVLQFDSQGNGHCLYTERIDLRSLGSMQIVRATTIEFNHQTAEWEVINPEKQLLFSHPSRSACLEWEQQHFNQ